MKEFSGRSFRHPSLDLSSYELTTLVVTNVAIDADLPPQHFTFGLDPSAPAGATINPTNGVLTWTPSEAQGPSTNDIIVWVTDDGSPPYSRAGQFKVTVREVNEKPELIVPLDQTIDELTTLVVTNVAIDADLPPQHFTFGLDPSAPTGANINPTNGVFTWTPSEAQGPTTNIIIVWVTDDGQPPYSRAGQFTVTVLETNTVPELIMPPDQTIDELTTLVVTNLATDADLPPQNLTFGLDPSAPAGTTINPTNGVFTWTPSEAQGPGEYEIIVWVTDDGNPPYSAGGQFKVKVRDTFIRITRIAMSPSGVVNLTWTSEPGTTCRVEHTLNLSAPDWKPLEKPITAGGAEASIEFNGTNSWEYYRIVRQDSR